MPSQVKPLDTTSSLLSPGHSFLYPDRSLSRNLAWETQSPRAEISARTRAYPSPPMSGASFLPPNDPREFCSQSRGSSIYSAESVEDGYGTALSQKRSADPRPQLPPPQGPMPLARFPNSYQQKPETERAYVYRGPEGHPSKSLSYSPHEAQHGLDRYFHASTMGSRIGTEPGHSSISTSLDNQSIDSPKSQRKTKGHVASACVPCKRAHLRCDAQRPCSRCISNGKEDSCVDVQHKKRGRPRLRDDRDTRFETMRQANSHVRDVSSRRPADIHPHRGPPGSSGLFDDHYQRLQSSRNSEIAAVSGMSIRQYERGSSSESNSYNNPLPATPGSLEPVAYLTMSLDFVKASMLFWDTLGLPSMAGRNLGDVVLPAELEKLSVMHSHFNTEQRRREPNYLPPILGHGSQSIQSLGFTVDDFGRFPLNFQDQLFFSGAGRFARPMTIRAGLAKEGSFYFVVLLLSPASGQTPHRAAPVTNGPNGLNGQGPQTGLSHQRMSPDSVLTHRVPFDPIRVQTSETGQTANAYRSRHSPILSSRPPGLIEHGLGQTGGLRSYGSPEDKQMHKGPLHRGIPQESALQKTVISQPSFQLPPIRPPADRAPPSVIPTRGFGERSSRVDIGGLLGDFKEPYRVRDDGWR